MIKSRFCLLVLTAFLLLLFVPAQSAIYNITNAAYYSQDSFRNYSYNGSYETSVSPSYTDDFSSNTIFRYANASTTLGTNWVPADPAKEVISNGGLILSSDTDVSLSARLKSYRFAGGVYEYSFYINDDTSAITSWTGSTIGTWDFKNYILVAVGNSTLGTSNLSIYKIIDGSATLINTTSTSSLYTRNAKTWMKIKYDPHQGKIDAWLRDNSGQYTSSPSIIGFINPGPLENGYFAFYHQTDTLGSGNLNATFDDLTIAADTYIGRAPISSNENNFYLNEDCARNSTNRYFHNDSAIWRLGGGTCDFVIGGGTNSSALTFPGIYSYGIYQVDIAHRNITAYDNRWSNLNFGFDSTTENNNTVNNGYMIEYGLENLATGRADTPFIEEYRMINGNPNLQWVYYLYDTSMFPNRGESHRITVDWQPAYTRTYYDGILVGTSTDANFTRGHFGFGGTWWNQSQVNFSFSNISFSGARIDDTRIRRGSQIGQFNDSGIVRQSTALSDDFNWNTSIEYVGDRSSFIFDTTEGALNTSITSKQIYIYPITFSNGSIEVTESFVAGTGSSDYIIFRSQAPYSGSPGTTGNKYYFQPYFSGNITRFIKINGGGSTTLGSGTYPFIPGRIYKIRVDFSGPTLTAYISEIGSPYPLTPSLTATDSSYSSGYIGFGTYFAGGGSWKKYSYSINAINQLSLSGVQYTLGGISRGTRYDTNEYAGLSWSTLPLTATLNVSSLSTCTTYSSSLNQMVAQDSYGTSGYFRPTHSKIRVATAIGDSTNTTLIGFDNSSLWVPDIATTTIFLNYSSWSGTDYDQKIGTIFFNPEVTTSTSPPSAMFTPSNLTTSIWFPDTITLNGTSKENPFSCLWDLGDGNTSTSCNMTYTYSATGRYAVNFTTTNEGGSANNHTIIWVNRHPHGFVTLEVI